jgi:hypothetical protein
LISKAGRERRWQRLDGFQRMAWLAMARALAEPELDGAVVQGAYVPELESINLNEINKF